MSDTQNVVETVESTYVDSIVQDGVTYPIIDSVARDGIDELTTIITNMNSNKVILDSTFDETSNNGLTNSVITKAINTINTNLTNTSSTINDINNKISNIEDKMANPLTYNTDLPSNNLLEVSNVYNLGILTNDISITLPNTANAGDTINVTYAISDTCYGLIITNDNINFNLSNASNTYYNITFVYDCGILTWTHYVWAMDYTI